MLHVSSVSKATILSPPLAISALLRGRKRATTIARPSAPSGRLKVKHRPTFDCIVATGATKVPASDRLAPCYAAGLLVNLRHSGDLGEQRIQAIAVVSATIESSLQKKDKVSAQRRRDLSLHRGSQAQVAKRVRSLRRHERCFDMERVIRRLMQCTDQT